MAAALTLVGVGLVVRAFPKSLDAGRFVNSSAGLNQARLMADKVEQSMRRWVVDKDALYGVFSSLKNNKEFEMMVDAFGRRRYDRYFWGLPDWMYDLGNLADWLNWSLNAQQIAKVNEILAGRGITYTF